MLKLLKFVTRSRLAQFLFVIHLLAVLYAFSKLPSIDSHGGCHAVPIADRAFYYCDATGLLRVIGTLDFIGVLMFSLFETFYSFFALLFSPLIVVDGPDLHTASWVVAVVLLVVTSFQWLLIGSLIEAFVRWLLTRVDVASQSDI